MRPQSGTYIFDSRVYDAGNRTWLRLSERPRRETLLTVLLIVSELHVFQETEGIICNNNNFIECTKSKACNKNVHKKKAVFQ